MSAARKDLSPGFSADDDSTVTRAQLRQRKIDRLRSSQAADGATTAAEIAEVLAAREPTTVVKQSERLEFRRASATADPEEQLRHYERTIGDAQTAVQGMLQAAHEQWVLVAGQALREVRDGRLFTHAGHESFDGYVQARWNIQRAHAYRLIDALPVVRALAGTVRNELKERQMRALVPVGRKFGDQAVRDVWAEAERRGRTSGAGLEEIAGILGYGEPLVEPAAQTSATAVVPSPRRDSVAVLRRAWSQFDARTIREAAGQDPDEVRRIVAELRGVLDEVEVHLGPVLVPVDGSGGRGAAGKSSGGSGSASDDTGSGVSQSVPQRVAQRVSQLGDTPQSV
ncbi:hypothetical protein [Streptomyces sp. SID3343]|uniref:hypothetical protein n=1 Tax=Streptomyces sp. SID3343 TaxID=2690260 RepID=UPI00136992D2|nr:hypothetical protein [Streptomyces sp. SID3343]MYW02972.1 hypothetical protein [Streptomyces sp. SID3343]